MLCFMGLIHGLCITPSLQVRVYDLYAMLFLWIVRNHKYGVRVACNGTKFIPDFQKSIALFETEVAHLHTLSLSLSVSLTQTHTHTHIIIYKSTHFQPHTHTHNRTTTTRTHAHRVPTPTGKHNYPVTHPHTYAHTYIPIMI